MIESAKPLSVMILDKEYRISCQPEERDELIRSARFLDGKMQEARKSGRVIGTERIAVMVALNIAHEMLQLSDSKEEDNQKISRRIRSMQEKIESAMNPRNQLEV